MNIYIENTLRRMVMAPVLVLTIFLVVSLFSIWALLGLNEGAIASRAVTNKVQEAKAVFLDMETGLRGYIASRDEAFLDPYWKGKERLPELLGELLAMTAERPAHAGFNTDLKQLSEYWIVYSESIRKQISEHHRGFLPKEFISHEGKNIMDEVRRVLNEISDEEEIAYAEKSDYIRWAVKTVIFVAMVVAIGSGIFLVLHIRKEALTLIKIFTRSRDQLEAAKHEVEQLNNSLEKMVVERTAALSAANEELEAFCYSISHDLRAPLRGIDGFSQALVEDYAATIDEQGRQYIRFVRQGVQRMGQLIDDLLNLSRLSRKEIHLEAVNLSDIATDCVEELKMAEPHRQVEVIIQPCDPVAGDRGLLRALMTNLLSNAWKFTSKVAEPRIEFGWEKQGEQPVFFVKDNGAGFDMAYYDKLFGAFQRLHSPQEFHGTGVGLATVRRIARRHGGEVWAQAKVGEGAAFYFTLGV